MYVSATVVGVLRGPLRTRFDLPVGRREETHAVRHAGEPEEARAFGEAHQLVRQVERSADLVPARALVALPGRGRHVLAGVRGYQRRLSGAARHPVGRGEIVRREALHDAGIGEEGFTAVLVERLELREVLADTGDLHVVA